MIETRNLSQYAELHQAKSYGGGTSRTYKTLAPWVLLLNPRSILDYGAGQNRMVETLVATRAKIRHRFDPAIPEISFIPLASYDLVTCTEVLEHLDESEVLSVLKQIHSLTKHALLAADTRAASTILPNGENAHATVKPAEWWLAKIREVFPEAEIARVKGSNTYIKTWRSGPLAHFFATTVRGLFRSVRRSKP